MGAGRVMSIFCHSTMKMLSWDFSLKDRSASELDSYSVSRGFGRGGGFGREVLKTVDLHERFRHDKSL